jgi:predicted nucleotidyltransferase
MAKKKQTPKKRDVDWAEAKRRCRLSDEEVRMAKELGFAPRSLIKNIPSPDQQWKASVRDWIRGLYEKKHGQAAPKPPRRAAESQTAGVKRAGEKRLTAVERADQDMLRQQSQFRLAAEAVAESLAELPQVERVVLFGSVAAPLWKEVPRFWEFRQDGIEIWHECKDVDLAVWVSDVNDLKSLQRARTLGLARLLKEADIGVAHHQVDVFLIEPGSNRYLGRLCTFRECPAKRAKCLVPGCGQSSFLRQHLEFVFRSDALAPERSVVLFNRQDDAMASDDDYEIPF